MAIKINEKLEIEEKKNPNRGQVAMDVPKYKVTDADKKYNTEAWKRWEKGNTNYYYKPGKGKA